MTENPISPIHWNGSYKLSKEGREILRLAGRVSRDFKLIEPGDRILVACSGGKDSTTLAWALTQIRRRVPFGMELFAINLDMGFGDSGQRIVGDFLRSQGLGVELIEGDAGKIGLRKFGLDGRACWFCARLRRGILYSQARRLGCNKLALGHHADDLIETLLINQFFSGQLKAMPPRLRTNDGSLIVIRPLSYVFEATITAFARQMRFPIIDCDCPYERSLSHSERNAAKKLLSGLSERIPDVKNSLLASLTHIKPSHLMDRRLYGFDD